MRDPITMEQDYKRSQRKPLLTLERVVIGFGLALTVLAFFLALSGCPWKREAQGAEPTHLTEDGIVVYDMQDPDVIRSVLDGAGFTRVVLDPDAYIRSLIFCIERIQAQFPDIPTDDIGLAGAWHVPGSGNAFHAFCTARRGITVDQESAETLCGLLKMNVLDRHGAQVVCGYTREDGVQI